jgi:hypothetical protein
MLVTAARRSRPSTWWVSRSSWLRARSNSSRACSGRSPPKRIEISSSMLAETASGDFRSWAAIAAKSVRVAFACSAARASRRSSASARFLRRDVLDLGDVVPRGAVSSRRADPEQQGPDRGAVGVEVALLEVVAVDLPGGERPHSSRSISRSSGWVRSWNVRVVSTSRGPPEDAAQRVVDLDELAVEAHERHADGGVGHRQAEPFLGLAEACSFSAPRSRPGSRSTRGRPSPCAHSSAGRGSRRARAVAVLEALDDVAGRGQPSSTSRVASTILGVEQVEALASSSCCP